MELLIALSFFFLISVITYYLLSLASTKKMTLVERLEEFNGKDTKLVDKKNYRAVLSSLSGVFLKATPAYKLKKVQLKLDACGLSKRYTPSEWLVFVYLVCGISGGVTLVITSLMAGEMQVRQVFFALIVLGLVRYFIHFYTVSKMSGRRKEIIRELPFALDLVTVSVQAGLSFDGAILKVVQTRENALSDEFEKFLKEVKIGVVRRVALKNMMARVNLDEINTLLLSIIQADELGVSISKVLKIQAEFIREQRKQAAREKALKAPVKMLIPLIIFIFPSIFVIILGPAIIKIMDVFG